MIRRVSFHADLDFFGFFEMGPEGGYLIVFCSATCPIFSKGVHFSGIVNS